MLLLRVLRPGSGVEAGFEALEGGVGPGVGGFAPSGALLVEEVGEVHAAVAAAGLEVEEGLGGAVEVEDGLESVAGPFDGGNALGLGALEFGVAFGEGVDVVDEHGVEDAVLVLLLGAVAGVEVGGEAFVLENDGPGNSGGVGGEKGSAGDEGKRLHISRYDKGSGS